MRKSKTYLCPPKKEGRSVFDFELSTWVVGAVVQLVRMLPCHGRGRGFESRPLRNFKLKPAFIAGFNLYTIYHWLKEWFFLFF